MGLKKIRNAGMMAAKLSDAANNMATIKNSYKASYDELLAAVQAALGDDKALSVLTEDEINTFFFGGLGDAVALTNAKVILIEWEKNIIQLVASVDLLPVNDI